MVAQRAFSVNPHPLVNTLGMVYVFTLEDLNGLAVLEITVANGAHVDLLTVVLGVVEGL
jgi:hypothetical protein